MKKKTIKIVLVLAIAFAACSLCVYFSKPKQATEVWSHSTINYGYAPRYQKAGIDTHGERLYVAGSTATSLQCIGYSGDRLFNTSAPLDIGGIYYKSNLLLLMDSHSFCVSRDGFQSSQMISLAYLSGFACMLHDGMGIFVSTINSPKIYFYEFRERRLQLSYDVDIHNLTSSQNQNAEQGEICLIGINESNSRVFFVYNTVLYSMDIATRKITATMKIRMDTAQSSDILYYSMSTDCKRLVILLGKNIVVVDLINFQILSSFHLPSYATAVDFDSDKDFLLVAYSTPAMSLPYISSGGNITRWDYSGKLHKTWSTKYRSIWYLSHNSNGCFVVADSSIASLKLE